MAQSECNIGVGKGTPPFVLCPDKRLCGNALDSHRNANLPWPLFFKFFQRGVMLRVRKEIGTGWNVLNVLSGSMEKTDEQPESQPFKAAPQR